MQFIFSDENITANLSLCIGNRPTSQIIIIIIIFCPR